MMPSHNTFVDKNCHVFGIDTHNAPAAALNVKVGSTNGRGQDSVL